jgi:hypothetical protein
MKAEGRRKKEEGRIIPTFPFSYFPVFSSPFFPPQARQSLWISIPAQSLEVKLDAHPAFRLGAVCI